MCEGQLVVSTFDCYFCPRWSRPLQGMLSTFFFHRVHSLQLFSIFRLCLWKVSLPERMQPPSSPSSCHRFVPHLDFYKSRLICLFAMHCLCSTIFRFQGWKSLLRNQLLNRRFYMWDISDLPVFVMKVGRSFFIQVSTKNSPSAILEGHSGEWCQSDRGLWPIPTATVLS